MDKHNNMTIEKNCLILSENGKIVVGVTDTSITNVVIPEGVEEVGENAFCNCDKSNIKTITFPTTLRKIGFASLGGIRVSYLSIPEGVEVIEEAAFFNSVLSYVSLPSTLKELDSKSFLCCRIDNLIIKCRDQKIVMRNYNYNYSSTYTRSLYVPSELLKTYHSLPGFSDIGEINSITLAKDWDETNWKYYRFFIFESDGLKKWWLPFIKEDGKWYIDDHVRKSFPEELRVTRGFDILCETFSYDGVHAEMIITMSDDLLFIDQEDGCFAQCRKSSDSSGAEYYVNLDFMKKNDGLFGLTPLVLSAISNFPKYMKIMPQKLDISKLEALGIMHGRYFFL